MPFRYPFVLTPDEEDRLATALGSQSAEFVIELGAKLGLEGKFEQSTRRPTIVTLIRVAGEDGQLRRLLRMLRRHSHEQIRAVSVEFLYRSFDDAAYVTSLTLSLQRAGIAHWELLYDLLRHRLAQQSAILPPAGWDRPPLGPTDFHARCEETVEILCELDQTSTLGFRYPLLHFVRDVFCTPIGSELPELRAWLRRAAARMNIGILDLVVTGWMGDDVLDQLAQRISARLGLGILVGSQSLRDDQVPTWDELLEIPAINVAVLVDDRAPLGTLTRRPPEPDDSAAINSTSSHLRRIPVPSYTPVLLVSTSGFALDPSFEVQIAARLPHKSICVQSFSLEDDLDARQIRAAVTKQIQSPRLSAPLHEERIEQVMRELTEHRLMFVVGPSLNGACTHTSGTWLAQALLADLEARFGDIHPMVTLDCAAYLHSLKTSPEQCRAFARRWLTDRSSQPSAVLRNLAQVFKSINQRSTAGERSLILTTNIDLWLECALLSAGVPFTRIVQKQDTTVSNRYDLEFSEDGSEWWLKDRRRLRLTPACDAQWDDLHRAILTYGSDAARGQPRLPWGVDDPPLVLYKFHGSVDHPDSVVMSAADYPDRGREQVPSAIETAAKNRRWLFVGFTLLDPQLRHLRLTLLNENQHAEHFVLRSSLSSSCEGADTLCIERMVWDQMLPRWQEDHFAEDLSTEASLFLDQLARSAS